MKIIGIIFILFSSIAASFLYEKEQKQKIKNAESLISFIQYIQTQIEYFSTPLDKIFSKYDSNEEFISLLINDKKTDRFDENCNKLIKDFFANIGTGYKKEQINLCQYTIDNLNTYLADSKNNFPKKIRIFRTVSVFIGMSVAILFI